ncbi:hypothetical protein Daus18300_010008 [Diaporthe australafricana]|uniref:Uncharacterized protein n=1 Tax=Diaporthe australafricana TaxID=127596 RepID=A0ABR3WBY4_9PEZI
MASTVLFYKFLCLVLWASLACLMVSAKPVELPALRQRRYMSNLSHIVDVAESVCDKDIDSFDDHPTATLLFRMLTCIDDGRCSSGCMITDAAPSKPTHICTPPLYCSLDGEGTDATFSCHTQGQGAETAKLDALSPVSTDQNVAPFKPNLHQELATPPAYTPQPEVITFDTNNLPPPPTPASSMRGQHTMTVQVAKGTDGVPGELTTMPMPANAPSMVPGEETVYVTLTSFPSPPTATAPGAKAEPDYTNDPEPNKTVITLGSIFGTMMVVGVVVVYVDRLRRRRRQRRQELQELQERHAASASSVEDVSELLRQQQQTYGYYGTQRIASGCVVAQEAEGLPSTFGPAELATPKDEIVEAERRDGH